MVLRRTTKPSKEPLFFCVWNPTDVLSEKSIFFTIGVQTDFGVAPQRRGESKKKKKKKKKKWFSF